MNEHRTNKRSADEHSTDERRPRRWLDPVTMLFGIGALLVAGTALTNGSGLLPGVDPRWLLASGAVLVGMLLLVGTLRRPRDGQ
ncbi:MAG TPA: hypothetical protein VGJ95_01350 [Pseudonocardiaceae bacterium]|jgi:hypothetical protein